jgi:alkylated DNA repair protein (DNA oxidative demethylase)
MTSYIDGRGTSPVVETDFRLPTAGGGRPDRAHVPTPSTLADGESDVVPPKWCQEPAVLETCKLLTGRKTMTRARDDRHGESNARFPLANDHALQRIAPGATHISTWLSVTQQAWIVAHYRHWVHGPVPPRRATVRAHEMSVQTVCLGWHWRPYQYSRLATDVNGNRVLEIPEWMIRLGREALRACGDPGAAHYAPDVALVNYYDDDARMGMHQDKDEAVLAPVVSISLGDTGVFRFGNPDTRSRPYRDLALNSGDLFVFGGPSRLAYHGVTKILSGTAPSGIGLERGRINITLRETGLRE